MKKVTLILTTTFLLALISCEETTVTETIDDANIDLSSEETSESVFEDVEVIADAAFDTFESSSAGTAGRSAQRDEVLDCATITRDTLNREVTVDYGEGCEGIRGRLRSGRIIISYNGERFTPGFSRTMRFEDFFVDSTQVEGTRTVSIASVDETANSIITNVVLTGGRLTFSDGTFITREADHTRTWTRQEGGDNLTTVTGSASGVTRVGESYSVEITEAIVFNRSCWISRVFLPVAGVKVFSQGDAQLIVDYGDGVCDNTITITRNGETQESFVILRGRRRF